MAVDGGHHAERRAADERREKLRLAGLTVVRAAAEVVMADVERAVTEVRAALLDRV